MQFELKTINEVGIQEIRAFLCAPQARRRIHAQDERVYAYLNGSIERRADGQPKHLSEILQAELDWLLATYDIAALDAAKREQLATKQAHPA